MKRNRAKLSFKNKIIFSQIHFGGEFARGLIQAGVFLPPPVGVTVLQGGGAGCAGAALLGEVSAVRC